jgi:hypothetical protein
VGARVSDPALASLDMRWYERRYALWASFGLCAALYPLGLVMYMLGFVPIAIMCYAVPAGFGAFTAALQLSKDLRLWRFERENPTIPIDIHIDIDSNLALVTLLNNELVSLEIPDEVMQDGQQAVIQFVLHELHV